MGLTKEDVRQLRKWYWRLKDNGYNTRTFLRVQGRNYGVHEHTIYDAVTKRTWKDVEESES